ncbi:DUF6452 family protein [Croceiramulus getboli]|nr:DUF6452 family protein [Flavobacteriaceae bacterium YJPT1-3]
MMPRTLLWVFAAALSVVVSGCERDDICAQSTPTTPLLIIEFYDVDNQTDLKPVTNLLVQATDVEEPFQLFNGVSRIALPLKTNELSTAYTLTLNAGSEQAENTDELVIDYETLEEFISRACGFKVTYNNVEIMDIPGTDGSWIQGLNQEQFNITNENEAHLFIFH